MNKLLKLSENHYIIVDDSEIKEGDCVLAIDKKPYQLKRAIDKLPSDKKITHSTQQLELPITSDVAIDYKLISLSEVEEAINGYNIREMATDSWGAQDSQYRDISEYRDFEYGYSRGFRAHQELVKDKLFTIEEMEKAIDNTIALMRDKATEFKTHKSTIIQSILPKTEWDVEFDEQGKIKLI